MDEEIKVIATPGIFFCSRIEWALKIKGIKCEYLEENLLDESPLLFKLNSIHKKVPVLVHNDASIVESLVILEYIDETWKGNSLLPQDPYERAMARFWAKFVDDKVIIGVWWANGAEGEEKKKAIESAQELLDIIERQIEEKRFFGGEKIGFLDLVVGWMTLWLSAMEEVGGMKLLDTGSRRSRNGLGTSLKILKSMKVHHQEMLSSTISKLASIICSP